MGGYLPLIGRVLQLSDKLCHPQAIKRDSPLYDFQTKH